MRLLIAAAFLVAAPLVALGDETSGTIESIDTAENSFTLTDGTVWMLPADAALPEATVPGDRVRVVFRSNADNGWDKIVKIERVSG